MKLRHRAHHGLDATEDSRSELQVSELDVGLCSQDKHVGGEGIVVSCRS